MLGEGLIDRLRLRVPKALSATFFVRKLGLTKVPLIFLAAPVVEEASDERCVVRIPLNYLTRNPLGSMYLGVLTIGADIAGGLLAVDAARAAKGDVSVVFKDLRAQFLKRPTSAVRFSCGDGVAIRAAVARCLETGERLNIPVHVSATVGPAEVAIFDLTLSIKRRV